MTEINPDNYQEPQKPSFSWLRIGKVVGVIVLVGAAAAGIYFFVAWNPFKIAWASWLHDRRENFVDCEHLPFNAQVEKAFAKNPAVVAKVKAVSGVLDFKPEADACRIYDGGIQFIKGQALLTYRNRAARSAAEKIIGKDFFGMPYRGEEVK